MRSVVCHNVSLVFRHVSCTSTFEIENLNCPGSYYKKGKIRGGGVLWQDEMIWNWSTCQTRCSPPQSLDTAPPVFISNYDSSLLININGNLEKTDSHFNHEHSQLLSSACIFSGPIGGVQCLLQPCTDQLKQKIRTNLKQSVVEVWGVSGNKYGRISNLKTLFDTRPGHRGDYFSYKARDELVIGTRIDILSHVLKWTLYLYHVYMPRLESANGARPQPPFLNVEADKILNFFGSN